MKHILMEVQKNIDNMYWISTSSGSDDEKYLYFQDNELKSSQISAIVGGNDTEPNYKDGRFTKTLYLSFKPERPKSVENYNIFEPEEDKFNSEINSGAFLKWMMTKKMF